MIQKNGQYISIGREFLLCNIFSTIINSACVYTLDKREVRMGVLLHPEFLLCGGGVKPEANLPPLQKIIF